MTTDPLCPQQHTHPKHDPNRCIFCEYGGAVREDERQRVTSDFAEYLRHMEEWQAGYSKGHAAGVEQGQRDEREAAARAVEARGGYHSASEFAAAIRAREEKP